MRLRSIASLLATGALGVLLLTAPHAAAGTDDDNPPKSPATAPDSAVQPGDPSATTTEPTEEPELPVVNLFDGLKSGELGLKAEGGKDGDLVLSVTNKSARQLRVVLPPGLVAAGASGQFGGMGGMGGGMMGGMGGGMGGGMMGGMGGMGGGMGGMGGMRGGMGGMGGMGGRGGMMGGGTMPPMMGMMMLARLVMSLVGDKDSWDPSSLMMGMMGGGMGGGMMGGMGGMGGGMGMMGGMGGMGGGMGMMGGGFRSIPPTALPNAALRPGQTRNLATRVVSLSPPNATGKVTYPAEGEPLRVGTIDDLTTDPVVRKALEQLQIDKAPKSLAQLVMWRLIYQLDWPTITQLSKGWANAYELSLARRFVDRMSRPETELAPMPPASLYVKIQGDDPAAAALREALDGSYTLGLTVTLDAPRTPDGPALAALIRFDGTAAAAGDREATVLVYASDAEAERWSAMGKFRLKVAEDAEAGDLADALAEGILRRLVRAQLTTGKKVKGHQTYKLRVDNASPLLLNGLALSGIQEIEEAVPSMLAGFSLPPRRSMTFTVTEDAVNRLGLEAGVQIIAADLSRL